VFKYQVMTLSQLGSLFGVTSHKVGKWLMDIGLRTTEGRPSRRAHQEKFVETAPSRNQGYVWAWHAESTVAALEEAGHRRVSPAPLDLVEPPALVAPFSLRPAEGGACDLVSADGGVAVRVWGSQNAEQVRRLLDLAGRFGKLNTGLTGVAHHEAGVASAIS
jgi:hypothetical protein